MTTLKKILFFLALVPTMTVVGATKHASWRQGVFPDDPRWPSLWNRRELENSENDVETKKFKLCETAECKKVADEFLTSMNKSMDPCEDFYEFACGGWTADNAIPQSMPMWSRFMMFQNMAFYRIIEALGTEPDASDILPVRQAKKWFRSCMDSETLERRGVGPIESILMQAGGWPISMDEEEWDAEEYTWQKVEREYVHFTGSYVFYDVTASPPSGEESKLGEIEINGPSIPLEQGLPLKFRNYSGNDYETYVHLVESAAKLFVRHTRADVSKDKIRKEAEEIVEFEKEIYELKEENHGYEEMTFEEFIEWYETNATEVPSGAAPLVSIRNRGKMDYVYNEKMALKKMVQLEWKSRIEWKPLIQNLFDMVNIKILPSAKVALFNIAYIKGIGELLRKTSPRTIVNYIHWKFVGNMMAYTTEHVRDLLFNLVREEYGVKQRPGRWMECIAEVRMRHAYAYAFVDKFFTKSTETAALKMIKNIQIELEDKIDKSNWLDEESKKISKDKLNSMKIFVGFPEWYKNRTAVINLYRGLSIGADYFDNTLSFLKYERKKQLRLYVTPSKEDNDPWLLDPITVNAMYGTDENAVVVPAADLQSPLFTQGLPDNVNYGIAGLLVGHEMAHGFDVNGIKFGKYGNKTNLSEDILKAYYQRAECFLDQFEGYYGETRAPKHEGTTGAYDSEKAGFGAASVRTRGENIADTTGMQAVFQAYRKLKKPGVESRLPGLEEFTDDQLFFVSFAAMWCEIETPEFEKKRQDSRSSHSPPRYRVIGAVSNTKDFAKAFNCPIGSSMNPINKCDIWEKPGAVPKSKPECSDRNVYNWGGQWRH